MRAYLQAERSSPDEDAVFAGNKCKRRGGTDDTRGSDGEYVLDHPRGRQMRISRRGSAQAPASPSGSDDSSVSKSAPETTRARGRGRGRPRGSRNRLGGRGQGHGRGVVRGGRSSVLVELRNLPRNVAADQCYGLLAADVDPFITELARLRLGAVALREHLDALGDDEASAVQRAELEPLVDKLERIDAQMAMLSARHDLTAACSTDAAARAACELCVEIAGSTAHTPDI